MVFLCLAVDAEAAVTRGFVFDFLAPFLVVEAIKKTEMGLADFYVRWFGASSGKNFSADWEMGTGNFFLNSMEKSSQSPKYFETLGFGYSSRKGAKTPSSEEKIASNKFTSSILTFATWRLCERYSEIGGARSAPYKPFVSFVPSW